jgi:uncharacterized iron-regulated membrane protein
MASDAGRAGPGFRQAMAGLHTWCGLVCGWLLCAIFLTGTLSVFREPITRWMAAEPVLPVAQGAAGQQADAAALAPAVRHLAAHAAGARFWRIELPQEPGDAIRLVWRQGSGQGQLALDPRNAELLPGPWGRATEGGRHFMSFHYMLQLPVLGYWLVGWVSMAMLVALVSGVVVHRRIFKDFFTFRPGKGMRSWLDAHNAAAVLTLPFQFMIVYTGLAIFYISYMPWPLQAAYGSDDKAYERFQSELATHSAPPLHRPRTGQAAALHELAPLLQQAQALMGQPVRMVVIEQPGDANTTVRVIGQPVTSGASRRLVNLPASVAFDGVSGAVLQVQVQAEAANDLHAVMDSLHRVRFGGWGLKWLYFASGLLGTAMVATGLLLFSVKRRQKSAKEFGSATARIYRAIDALNVTAIAGITLASIAYFYANRLIPAELTGRADCEIRSFLAVWLASLLHALSRPALSAWLEQLGAAALLCLCLPLLNLWTTGQHLGLYVMAADAQRAGVELTALALGLLLMVLARKVARRSRAP